MKDCSICLKSIYIAKEPWECGHAFHGSCISKWNGSCPLCRMTQRKKNKKKSFECTLCGDDCHRSFFKKLVHGDRSSCRMQMDFCCKKQVCVSCINNYRIGRNMECPCCPEKWSFENQYFD